MRIVIFDIDCLRPDHLGCFGYKRPTSPTLDSIADGGICFDHYYCASSPCLPSRMGFASGRFGINNGVISNHSAGARFRIDATYYGGPKAENEMLMRNLRRAGWDTISFSNFADRHSTPWYMCGWSEFHTPNLKGGGETAAEVNDPLMRWLEHNASRDNYLLHVNYWDAHRCYKMEPSWAEPLKGHPVAQEWPGEEVIRRHQSLTGAFTATGQFKSGKSPFPLMPDAVRNRADFEHMITGYDAAIRYVDHHVSLVMEEFEKRGLLDDTAIIVTADHGDAFGEHGIYSDHVCADECIQHIPLIIRWPGVTPSGVHCRNLVYNVDLSATLCELMGAEIPARWDGISFAPQVRGEDGPKRDYLVWDHGLYTVQRAVRTEQHLMIRTYDDNGYQFRPLELYDMESDPFQTRDLSGSEPEVLKRCEGILEEWMEEQKAKGWGPDPVDLILDERRGKSG